MMSQLTHVNKMVRAGSTFLISVYAFILKILGFVARYICRSNTKGNGSYFSADHSKEGGEVVTEKSTVFLLSGPAEKGSSESENLDEITSKTEDSVSMEAELVSSNSKYQFMPGEDVSGFEEKPETVKFRVEELFVESNDALSCSDQSLDDENSPKMEYLEAKMEENILEFDKELEVTDQEKIENSATFDDKILRFEAMESMDVESMDDQDFSYEIELFPGSKLSTLVANRSPNFSELKLMASPQKVDSNNRTFLEEDDHRISEDIGTNVEEQTINQTRFDSDDEYIELEPTRVNPTNVNQESFASEESKEAEELNDPERLDCRKDEGNSWDSNFNDENEPDVLWEHHHLVQQMKLELKNCRSGGLPTISEDCETPKMVEDLKPLNFDQKFEYKDLMEEIHKFYRTYAEKMRKLDVLNFQTLQAISFLQLKDSEIFSGKKKSASMLKQLAFAKIWPGKVQRIHADPALRSIVELNRDLELVYVGQICLSWEILSWLYVKSKELLPYDSQGNHSYNRVVEEFQQFQVLMQRFMEDEPFQGPRVQNYVRNRCMIRSLLQVPLIRDDCLKDKKERDEEDSISLELLVRVIKESMLVFREFLHSDKSSKDHGAKMDIKEPENMALLADVITTLQKKERRLKENIRSKSCIVKMMQKQEECDQICTCEVELRLVSRVIGLSRVSRDQLIWCQNKLRNINFVNRRRVHLEPSLLLFPC
ncbi:uncharacterized protein [Henckelia pumila]|uniref:uncharacterized protein n=1 Tax=Henckelia pumila TaxID=405737 RepID=UPI003C6EA465